MEKTRWHTYADPDAVADAAAVWILRSAEQAIAEHDLFRIVLAGGTTPRLTYSRLAKAEAEWEKWHVFFGDERCLSPDSPDRNSLMAEQAWLKHVAIPAAQIHAIPAELGALQGAREYQKIMCDIVSGFDLVLLGMGEDGHTASLFPAHDYPEQQAVHAVFDAPKPPPERVTLSASMLSHTQTLLFLITGSDKNAPVRRWRGGTTDFPAASIMPENGVDVLVDTAALEA